MVSKSRQQQLAQLYVGAPYGRGIDHDKYSTIGILLLVLAAFGWYRGYVAYGYALQRQQPAVVEPFSTTIHINSARKVELCLLPGVGPKLAQAILDFRAAHGPIRTWEQLDEVKGIGPKTIEEIKVYASLE
jgi:competence protein ComEA